MLFFQSSIRFSSLVIPVSIGALCCSPATAWEAPTAAALSSTRGEQTSRIYAADELTGAKTDRLLYEVVGYGFMLSIPSPGSGLEESCATLSTVKCMPPTERQVRALREFSGTLMEAGFTRLTL